MNIYRVIVGMICALLIGVGCAYYLPSEPQLAVSYTFCGYTNDGHSAIFQLTNRNGSIAEYSGPYVECWDGKDWQDYPERPAAAAPCVVDNKPMNGPIQTMTVTVPPGRVRWRTYVSCLLFSQELKGKIYVWSRVIQQ